MLSSKDNVLLALAMTSLGFSVLLERLVHYVPGGNFFAGVGMGLSITLSAFCLVRGVMARGHE